MLSEEFRISLDGLSLNEVNKSFHSSKFFFVHAAKVRPLVEKSPPPEVITFCAKEHLRNEIPILNPNGICFLGLKNASFAAEAVFEQTISRTPIVARISGWQGKVVVAPQPVPYNGGIRKSTASVLRLLMGNAISS